MPMAPAKLCTTAIISLDHLLSAVAEEFAQNEDLPNTSNPDEWARISGRPTSRVASVEVIRHG